MCAVATTTLLNGSYRCEVEERYNNKETESKSKSSVGILVTVFSKDGN